MSRMPDNYNEAESWARDRVGKRVYRHALSCKCGVCARVVDDGLVIADKYHASYITDYAMELGYRYADSREELEPMKNKRFFNGWLLFTTAILLAATAKTFYEIHLSDSPLPPSNWWWVVAVYILVFGGRSYQYFIQKR